MKALYDLINYYSKLSLQAIGILTLVFENDSDMEFITREAFLDYFKLSTHYIAEKVWSELIDLGIVTRVKKENKHIYKIKGFKSKIIVPVSYSDNKVLKSFMETEMGKFDEFSKNIVNKVLEGYKRFLLFKEIEFKIEHAEKFFSIFEKQNKKILIEFYQIYESKQLAGKVGYEYLKKIMENILPKDVNRTETVSKDLKWNENKQKKVEEDFAIKVATGEAIERTKYQILLRNKRTDELKKYYELGCRLIEDKTKIYKEYAWLYDKSE
jgi:hypothetical protein